MRVIDFVLDANWLKQFLDWPQHLYASDPNWMPDQAETRFISGRASSSTIRRNFLVLEGDQVRGRLTAMVNPQLLDASDRPYGQLGFFECMDDLDSARCLVEAASAWLREYLPNGGTILAPMDFDTWHAYRLRTAGFDEPSFFMEPYNPQYYQTLFSALNFTPISRYVTKTVNQPASLMSAWEEHHQAAMARGYRFRSIDPHALDSELAIIYRLSLMIFRENLFFTEIPESEFRALYSGMAARMDPDLFLFLLDPLGEPVGISFSSADHRVPGTVNIKTFGVLPRVRNEGVGAALAYEAYRRFAGRGFSLINHCLMRTGNRADQFDSGLGAVTREYCLYASLLGQ